ncbi:Uncharacterised protein [Mycobacteroides abscessus subsp. abscessus]|nr:Uncharacterised protein [Mycobacteroides abscessus subsp. abscessus]
MVLSPTSSDSCWLAIRATWLSRCSSEAVSRTCTTVTFNPKMRSSVVAMDDWSWARLLIEMRTNPVWRASFNNRETVLREVPRWRAMVSMVSPWA